MASEPRAEPARERPETHSSQGADGFWGSRKLLLLILFLTTVMRVIVALRPQVIHVDGAFQYLPAAQRYYEKGLLGGLEGTLEMPIFPVSIALLTKVTGDLELSARLISLLAGILAVVPLYFLGRDLFGGKIAAISCILFAGHPLMVKNSSEVAKESLFGLIFVTGMWLGWLAVSRRKLWVCLGAGVVGALAYLTRPDGLDLFVVWGVWLGVGFLWHIFRDKKQALIRLAAAALIAAPTLCLGGAYVLYAHHRTGQWTLSLKKPLDRLLAGRAASRAEVNLSPWERMRLGAGRALSSLGEVAREIFNEFDAPILGLFVLGLFMRRGALFTGRDRYLTMLCGLQLVVCFLIARHFSPFQGAQLVRSASSFSGRHLLTLLLAGWCWVGWGCIALERAVGRVAAFFRCYSAKSASWRTAKHEKRAAPGGAAPSAPSSAVTIALVSLLFLGLLPSALKAPHADKLAHKYTGLWLRERGVANAVMMCSDRRVAYYAGLPEKNVVRPPKKWLEGLDSALEGARARHVDYVIFSDKEVPRAQAQIETAVRKGQLRLIYRTPLSGLENDTLYEIVSP